MSLDEDDEDFLGEEEEVEDEEEDDDLVDHDREDHQMMDDKHLAPGSPPQFIRKT